MVVRDWEERAGGKSLFNGFSISVLQDEKSSGDEQW